MKETAIELRAVWCKNKEDGNTALLRRTTV